MDYFERHPIRHRLDPLIESLSAEVHREVGQAIADLHIHKGNPYGKWARYVDTLCGEVVHWTKIDRIAPDDPEPTQAVTCSDCLAFD